MAPKLSSDFVKTQKIWIKKAMKGRPVHFGIQAAGAKKGKFLVSKKPGDCKSKAIKELQPYEGSGSDAKKAEAMNTIKAAPALGVCKGANGTLTLYVEKGPEKPAFGKFVKFFVSREMKIKLVKRVEIAEVEEGQLPAVPDKDPADDEKPTLKGVQDRAKDLLTRGKEIGVAERVKVALELAKNDPEGADERLDEVDNAIFLLDWAKKLNKPDVLTAVLPLLKGWDLDTAEETLEAAGAPPETVEETPAAEGDGKFVAAWSTAKKGWETANATVDKQIDALQKELQGHSDKDIQQIGATGLNDLKEFKRDVVAAVANVETAASDAAGLKKMATEAIDAIKKLAEQLNSDERVKVIADSPFTNKVDMNGLLKPALLEMAKTLNAAAG